MQKSCPSCGAELFPGARFCRRCGTPVRDDAGTGEVSPRAATVPLQEAEGRATEGLAAEQGRPSPETSRVSLSDMERLLRSQHDSTPKAQPNATHSAVTRPDVPGDEELTISVPRRAPDTRDTFAHADSDGNPDPEATHDFEATRPARDSHDEDSRDEELTRVGPTRVATQSEGVGARAATKADGGGVGPSIPTRRRWPVVVGVSAGVLVLASLATLAGFRLLRRPSLTDLPSQGPTAPTPAPDAAQRFEEKMVEAEAMLAQGNMEAAVARLREANAVDPSNSRAHRRLAELLLASGARRDAIEELRAAARNAPDDFTVWRQLAMAQFAEGLYRDAADSYRRLLALAGDAADPNDLLSYADSLRLSGRADEARAVYQKLTASASPDVADLARQRLGELAQYQPTPTPAPHEASQPGAQQPREGESASLTQPGAQPTPQPTPQPQPTPTPAKREQAATPEEHYRRGQMLWSSNRPDALEEFRASAAGGDFDAHYYLGLSYVEGRSLHSLKRAEVVAALQHFQLAQRGRQFVAESRRYQQQLEKEFDRLRGQ
jgi:tetratricopeptide (TPR) repeat protein